MEKMQKADSIVKNFISTFLFSMVITTVGILFTIMTTKNIVPGCNIHFLLTFTLLCVGFSVLGFFGICVCAVFFGNMLFDKTKKEHQTAVVSEFKLETPLS